MVYLQVDTDEAVRRIHKRGREDEVDVEWQYWDNLNRFYENNYKDFALPHLLVIKVDRLDYVHRPEDRNYMVDKIRSSLIID
jgi:deoxyadenosine/deoxycytidine kinase